MDFYGHSTTRALTADDVEELADAAGKRLFLTLSLTAGATQSSRLRSALRVARRSSDVYSLAYPRAVRRGGDADRADRQHGQHQALRLPPRSRTARSSSEHRRTDDAPAGSYSCNTRASSPRVTPRRSSVESCALSASAR